MLLFYVRHGDPIYHPDSLTPLGKRQAEAVGHRLAQFGLDRVYASTSTRAVETAQPTCEMLKIEPILLDWCQEHYTFKQLHMVNAEGKRTWMFQNAEMRRFFNSEEIRRLGKEWYRHERFAGSTYEEGMERIRRESDAFLAELGYVHLEDLNCYRVERPNDERVALFAHQGFGLALLSCMLDIPYPMFSSHFDFGHSSVTVIEFADEEGYCVPRVLQLANDGHLWRDGVPTNYQNRLRF